MYKFLINISCFICYLFSNVYDQEISLAGEWGFAMDRHDEGVKGNWFNKKLEETIKLPGSMAENGKGDAVTLQTRWTATIYDSSFFFRPSQWCAFSNFSEIKKYKGVYRARNFEFFQEDLKDHFMADQKHTFN